MRIIFDSKDKRAFLNLFGKTVDNDGFIVDQSTKEKVITPEGENIKESELGGIIKGSQIFFKSDIDSIVKIIDKYYGDN